MKNPVQHFEANTVGRDFVIGDLHGSIEVLINLLDNLQFDKEKDRLFSVGDLVDRGPSSEVCLELIKEPWFHCVLANHEQMMVDCFDGGYMGQFWFRNGGQWGLEHYKNFVDWTRDKHLEVGGFKLPPATEKFLELVELVRELPFVITVDLMNGSKVHIIHAEIHPADLKVITDDDLADPVKVLNFARQQSDDGDYFVWGRYKYYQFYKADLSNQRKVIRTIAAQYRGYVPNDKLSHIISGHTIVQKPFTILGQTNIDTGAYGSYPSSYGSAPKWCALTCLELNTWEFYQATATEFREVKPEVVNTAAILDLKKDENSD